MRHGRASAFLVMAYLVVGFVGSVAGASPAAADSAQVRFADPALQLVEDGGTAQVVVERVDLPVSRLVVTYRTEEATARPGEDYTQTAGTLVFDVGVRSSMFSVPVRDDDIAEDTEHLLLHLETSTGVGASSRLTIIDEDVPASGAAGTTVGDPAVPASAGRSGGRTVGASTAPVVVASAGASRPAAAAQPAPAINRTLIRRPAPRRQVTLQQSPVTPFELRPSLGSGDASSTTEGPSAVDPVLALAAGLCLARVAAELWFRTRALVP